MSRIGSLAPERPGPDPADGLAFLESALRERRADGGAHALVLLPGPVRPPARLGAASRPPSVVFDAPHAGTVRGWDVALELARGDHDLATVARAARHAHERTRLLAHPDLPDGARRGLLWIGGHSFVAGACRDRAWASFPDAYFFVPRWTHHTLDGVSVLALALGAGDTGAGVEGMLAEYASLMDAAAAAPAGRAPAPCERAPADRARWIADVRSALAAIEDGRLRKVVLARHLELVPGDDGALDLVRVLGDLERRFPSCTRFLLARDGAEFFGATPETLVRRRGREVVAEAMAGSCRRGDEAALLASGKDAREHAIVVDEIASRLRPHCDALQRPAAPEVERLANVSHLCTRIDGRLRDATHVLRLVADLHPTPAVSGTPNAAAVDWLTRAEPVPRGWYAAPFGWFDAAGDGHFVVALRSCVRHAGRLRLYAGAGIVRGSEPEREFDETVLKMRAMLDGLHVGADEPAERVG